ncbi:hypothetical protein [Fischerella thermalis]|uniref:hypothetical protein n=1 Tax=Fischerella thermalis TaxID=372787 RepID=UPI002155436A|nr:hypothetical protein [Fischerella thermalis]
MEQIGREITVRIVDTQNPTVSGSGVLIKHSGDTDTVLTAVLTSDRLLVILYDWAMSDDKPLRVYAFQTRNSKLKMRQFKLET